MGVFWRMLYDEVLPCVGAMQALRTRRAAPHRGSYTGRGEELDDIVAAARRTMTETMDEGPA